MRLIHFGRLDPQFGNVGFYLGYHNLRSFTEEERREFTDLMCQLFGPTLPSLRKFRFYFTRYGFRKHKKLIRYLIRATAADNRLYCHRVWKQDFDVVYEDKEQVALCPRKKVIPRKRLIKKERKRCTSET